MPPIAWLVVALVAGVAGYLIAWPAWQSYRIRDSRDLNAERYLAWRGRAVRGDGPRPREGMTGEERRRLFVGAALAVGAVLALIAFFITS